MLYSTPYVVARDDFYRNTFLKLVSYRMSIEACSWLLARKYLLNAVATLARPVMSLRVIRDGMIAPRVAMRSLSNSMRRFRYLCNMLQRPSVI